jgi:tRNA-binding protein
MNPLDAFETLDLRVGRIVRAEPNERARKPSFKLWIDFGPLGQKTSSAQLATLYRADQLQGRLVVAAVNLGARSVAGFMSEVLARPPRLEWRGGSAGCRARGAAWWKGVLSE